MLQSVARVTRADVKVDTRLVVRLGPREGAHAADFWTKNGLLRLGPDLVALVASVPEEKTSVVGRVEAVEHLVVVVIVVDKRVVAANVRRRKGVTQASVGVVVASVIVDVVVVMRRRVMRQRCRRHVADASRNGLCVTVRRFPSHSRQRRCRHFWAALLQKPLVVHHDGAVAIVLAARLHDGRQLDVGQRYVLAAVADDGSCRRRRHRRFDRLHLRNFGFCLVAKLTNVRPLGANFGAQNFDQITLLPNDFFSLEQCRR